MMTLDEMKLAVCGKLPKLIQTEHIINQVNIGKDWDSFTWYERPLHEIHWPTEGLQVCHEAEKLLGDNLEVYVVVLIRLLHWSSRKMSFMVLIHATYEQRLEALCRVWCPERFE